MKCKIRIAIFVLSFLLAAFCVVGCILPLRREVTTGIPFEDFYNWTGIMALSISDVVLVGILFITTFLICCIKKNCYIWTLVFLSLAVCSFAVGLIVFSCTDVLLKAIKYWTKVNEDPTSSESVDVISFEKTYICCGYDNLTAKDRLRCATYNNTNYKQAWRENKVPICKPQIFHNYKSIKDWHIGFCVAVSVLSFVLIGFSCALFCEKDEDQDATSGQVMEHLADPQTTA